jgi:hypothetical protein
MGRLAGEESLEKRRKIDRMHLSTPEWGRVQTFSNLLSVSTLYNSPKMLISSSHTMTRLPRKLNKHFHHPPSQHYATLSPPLRSYT